MAPEPQIKQAIGNNGAFNRGVQYYRHNALKSLEIEHKDFDCKFSS
jgi:hypothetical protein